jgi:hypothetical protein
MGNMNLDESQRNKVAEWIAQGLRLSDIQNRLASDLGVRMTYMEVRLLVDDLKLTPKDPEPVKAPASVLTAPGAPSAAGTRPPAAQADKKAPAPAEPAGAGGSVSVSVDQIARPGAVVSGKVSFSDGQRCDWYFDQTGRLGLVPQQPGYRPPNSDLQQFQTLLDAELSKMGF